MPGDYEKALFAITAARDGCLLYAAIFKDNTIGAAFHYQAILLKYAVTVLRQCLLSHAYIRRLPYRARLRPYHIICRRYRPLALH